MERSPPARRSVERRGAALCGVDTLAVGSTPRSQLPLWRRDSSATAVAPGSAGSGAPRCGHPGIMG